MSRQLSQGFSKYGAQLGRPDKPAREPHVKIKFILQQIRIDRGGYDRGGAYWGLGPPLYWAVSEDGVVEKFFRARDRYAAKDEIRKEYPNASFQR